MVDHSHLDAQPRVGRHDDLTAAEVVALLPSLPDWPTPERLAGPAGKATRARTVGTINGVRRILKWLLTHSGDGWQERWLAAGADDLAWIDTFDPSDPRTKGSKRNETTSGLAALMLLRVVIVSYDCLNTFKSGYFLARARAVLRPDLFERVRQAGLDRGIDTEHLTAPMAVLSRLALHTGRDLDQLNPGDLLAFYSWGLHRKGGGKPYGLHLAWELLSVLGVTEAGTTLRHTTLRGQRTTRELVEGYGVKSAQIRELLIRYLDERRASYDYISLRDAAYILASLFWVDIEKHHPGIDTIDLPSEVIAAWKERIGVVTDASGNVRPREDVLRLLVRVRSFYLDIQHWAVEDPTWAPWAVPSPISRRETKGLTKLTKTRRSRMHQRVRERLPQLPTLVDSADRRRSSLAALLKLASNVQIGDTVVHDGARYRRDGWKTRNHALSPQGIRVTNLTTDETFDLSRREDEAFWSWAIIETLRHTGVRIEELLELTHLALVSYRLPDTGELVPLLQIAPSKSDKERLLLIGPELASVIATIITRLRSVNGGTVRLVSRFDHYERLASAPLPHLFQRMRGGRSHVISPANANRLIKTAITAADLRNTSGQRLTCTAHDFRRMFATEAVTNGLPVHIAARLLGHSSLETTQAYLAVFQKDLIRSYRAFLDQRRATRPAAEYREPTDEEWTEFQQHFQVRRLELGDCGRPYGSPCSHEHACIRCPMLRVDPRQRNRLLAIIHNLTERVAEAKLNGWLGEAQGLQTSLEAAKNKLASLKTTTSSSRVTDLGMPIVGSGRRSVQQ